MFKIHWWPGFELKDAALAIWWHHTRELFLNVQVGDFSTKRGDFTINKKEGKF